MPGLQFLQFLTVSELLKENQQGGGGGKITLPSPTLGLTYALLSFLFFSHGFYSDKFNFFDFFFFLFFE